MRTIKKPHICLVLIILLIVVTAAVPLDSQTKMSYNSAELQIMLDKLDVLGSVLYLAAHPDDENTAVLAWLSLEKKYRTAYLSLTRGDGGQNLIGPEKGAEVGIIRTQELLQARSIDRAEQFFSRAVDFGYSKTAEESYKFWDREMVLADVVWVIRKFRPDVIITRFPPNGGGHGHHAASAQLALDAFKAAADPRQFPEQLQYVSVWQTERLFWNTWRPDRSGSNIIIAANVGAYNPILGKSYTELAAESRTMHKSQGFGSSGRRGDRNDSFQLIMGSPAESDIFEGINTTWSRVADSSEIGNRLRKIGNNFDPGNPAASVAGLVELYGMIDRLRDRYWSSVKKRELREIIKACSGLWMEAIADDFSASPGERVNLRAAAVNRSGHPFTVESISLPEYSVNERTGAVLHNNETFSIDKSFTLPEDAVISQPFWLLEKPLKGSYVITDQRQRDYAEHNGTPVVRFSLLSGSIRLVYDVPLTYRWTDRVDGEQNRPFEIRPPVTVNPETAVMIFHDRKPKEAVVKIKSHANGISGDVTLKVAGGWKITPESISFNLDNRYDEQFATFTASPPDRPTDGVITVEASVNGKTYSKSLVEIDYPHFERRVYFPDAGFKAVKLEIEMRGRSIGYIMGAGDRVPDGLSALGYEVTLLDDSMLESADFSSFDAIITGIRAYNTRPRLPFIRQKLMDYVKNGGTLVSQYNVTGGLLTDSIGPYPFSIGRGRVSVEEAPVTILKPDHQLFTFPNRITAVDFDNWVQERGLYFTSNHDSRYETVLSSHDPGEEDKDGGMLFTRYGEGVFIYTSYSWFRQLPAGVPGAYKLFVNMISAGQYNGK